MLSNKFGVLRALQSNHAIHISISSTLIASSHSSLSFSGSQTCSPAFKYLRRKVLERRLLGFVDTARDRTESEISARAFEAFLDVIGTVESVCDSRDSQVGISMGFVESLSSNDFSVVCNDVRGVVSDSSPELALSSERSDLSESRYGWLSLGGLFVLTRMKPSISWNLYRSLGDESNLRFGGAASKARELGSTSVGI